MDSHCQEAPKLPKNTLIAQAIIPERLHASEIPLFLRPSFGSLLTERFTWTLDLDIRRLSLLFCLYAAQQR